MIVKNPKTVPMIQYVLFAILVVATPFVVVTKYLQGGVYLVSHLEWTVLGIEIPILATLVVAGFIAFMVWQRHNILPRRVLAALVIVAMIAISQKVQDLYGDMSLYDLQRNWHYVAYGAYVFMFFQAFHVRGMSKAKMILISFFSAISLSLFDELFQFKMSNRVFDLSDISKDSWGCVMGLILVLFVSETYGRIDLRKHSFRQKKLSGYGRDPLAALMVTGSFSFVTIMLTPLLTDSEYVPLLTLICLAGWIVLMAIIHFSQYRPFRITLITVIAAVIIALSGSFVINRNENIHYHRYGFTMYKGLPIPFFDVLIYPNGLPRLVDKKHFFNGQDRQFLLKQREDILLISSGYYGKGGRGFKIEQGASFMFNEYTRRGTQIIILPNVEAVKTYNRLKKEGKKVLFVLHNTC